MKRTLGPAIAALAVLAALLSMATPGSAAPGDADTLVRPLPIGNQILQVFVSPDGARVLYTLNTAGNAGIELWSVPAEGGRRTRLSTAGSSAGEVLITPDSRRVVFTESRPGRSGEVFSIRIGGGGRVRLSPSIGTTGFAGAAEMSADGRRVVFLHRSDINDSPELWSAPTGGGAAVKLNGPMVRFGVVETFAISPDSTTVVFVADKDVDNTTELYAVPIEGGPVTKLNGDLGFGEVNTFFEGDGFIISPNSTRVVFWAREGVSALWRLWSVPIGGGPMIELNDSEPDAIRSGVERAQISPDSSRVVYGIRDGALSSDLYSVPIGGGAPVQLSPPRLGGARPSTASPSSPRTHERSCSSRCSTIAHPSNSPRSRSPAAHVPIWPRRFPSVAACCSWTSSSPMAE